ncbi:neuronal acetylcholine receptor subunit alpha-3-like [Crassostrea angulata]|uniref:neuronal acetylcholine receptor subunit alpha-3-like n=1 Tax=Magallana angulata TaxID=2784310 RepID=UPI0022B094CD|nr:neuronal acetylcholine receptor subunit alpha-3-like [Crassostrea angulata]
MGEFTTRHATQIHSVFDDSYNKYVRPFALTNISIELVLFSIDELDVKRQTMSSSGWLTVTWDDPRLTWNASAYGGIEYIYTKQDKIWCPELIIDNSVEGIKPIGDKDLYFKVKHTGEVRWDPPGRYITHCEFDVTYFPFDYQKCSIEIVSFGFSKEVVTLKNSRDTINIEDYQDHGGWVLHSTRTENHVLVENGEEFSMLEFQMIFERRPGYYITNIIYPVILVSLLTNLVFLLPADSGEKISYILTVLLAQAVLLTLIGNSMPTTSKKAPLIEVYVSFVLMLAALSIVITILNLRLHLRADQSAVPKWLKFFTLKVLLRISCRSSRVEDYVVSNEVSNEGTAEYHFLNRMSATRPQVPIRKDRVFPFHCKEVSALLDLFFFHLFNIIMFIMTMVLVIILSVSDGPPTKTTHSE